MLTLPSRNGFTIEWETGEVRVVKYRNRDYGKEIKVKDSFESTSREEVEAKQRKLKEQGYKVSEIMECIF